MANCRRINPVYRSISRPLTIRGVERKLFFFVMYVGAGTFNLLGSLLGGILMFLLLYFFARWAINTDPQILRLLLTGHLIFGRTRHSNENNVPEARARKGWTQLDLADAVNVSMACVNAVEHGRYDPSLILAYDIAEALGMNIVEVFPREFRRPPKESSSQKRWYLRLFSLTGQH